MANHISITVSTPIRRTFRVEQIAGMFDLTLAERSEESFRVAVPDASEAWTIGAIVGPSASGKTTIARAAYGDAVLQSFDWPRDEAVIEAFGPMDVRKLLGALAAVGFNSPLAWLRPYHVLSGGERFRCDLARALLSPRDLIVCDEFTSVVDRTVARIGSAALAKALRRDEREPRRFVAVTCHDDVLPWLEPDWVLDMQTRELAWGRLRRPPIELRVERAPQAAWRLFARHHYLSGGLSRGAQCYIASWEERPVAFCAVVRSLGHRGCKRATRLVTLPDYQGLGIGARLLEHVGRRVLADGERFTITTSHPAMLSYLSASPLWQLARVRRSYRPSRQCFREAAVRDSQGRAVASFEMKVPSSK